MRTIKLTDKQADLLESILENELDQEYINSADDKGEFYGAILDIYKSVLAKPKNFIDSLVKQSIIADRLKELEELQKEE